MTTPPKRPRGSGSVYRRGTVWWVAYYRDGLEIRETSRSTKREVAEGLLRRRLGDIEAGRPVAPRADRVTVAELLIDYLADSEIRGIRSLRHAMRRARKLEIALGRRRAQSVTAADVRQFIAARQRQDAAPATINRELAVLRRAFRLGIEAERIHRMPKIRALPENNVRAGFFDQEKLDEVRKHLREEVARDIATLGYWSGFRLGELLALETRQVDVKARAIVVEPGRTKGGEGRTIFLEGEAWAIVEKWYRRRATGRVLARRLFHRGGAPIRSIRGAWANACAKAGYPGMLFHDLRRSAVRNMIRVGIPEVVAMKISGHKTRSVFDRYNIVSETDLKEAARRLASPTKSPTKQTDEKWGS